MTKVFSILSLLFALMGPAHAITPESGWWWNPNASGTGYNIEIQDNMLAVATYVFDASGAPTYYISAGAMSNDSTYSGTLNLYTGGQCVGCAYKAPSGAAAGTITIKFSSAQQGTLTMNGGAPISIQRFGFGVNAAAPYAVMGEWAITEGGKSYPVYYGDRIQFSTTMTSTSADTLGMLVAVGSRSGSTGALAIAYEDKGKWYLLIGTSASYFQYYVFTFTGLNSIEGTTWVFPRTSSPSGAGSPFIAYRSQSASLVKTGVGPGAKAQELSPQQRSQALADSERRDEQRYLGSDRDGVNTDPAFSGNLARVMAVVRELQQVPQQ
jgi:hypothetical protein